MKRLCKFFAVFLFAMIFASCASTDFSNLDAVNPGDYIGAYDASMTPENSCVIIFGFSRNDFADFKQINPDFASDVQHFDYTTSTMGRDYGWTIFKPCKPGSRYMLTKFKGHERVGNILYTWDIDFLPNQKIFVIDVPKKPGIYVYTTSGNSIIFGTNVAAFAEEGRKFQLPDPDGKHSKSIYKSFANEFAKHYGQTPWLEAFLKKREQMINSK